MAVWEYSPGLFHKAATMERKAIAELLGMTTASFNLALAKYGVDNEMVMPGPTLPLLVVEDLIRHHAVPSEEASLLQQARAWAATSSERGVELTPDPNFAQGQIDSLWSTFRAHREMVNVRLVSPEGKVYDLPAVDKRGLNLLNELYPEFAVQYRED